MKIKQKLGLGIGVFFVMIVILITLSVIYINKLSDDTKKILVANYNSIDYSRKMLNALNEGIADSGQSAVFMENLKRQQNNITEQGEQELTDRLSMNYLKLSKSMADSNLLKNTRADIIDIIWLNMQAIQRKSAIAVNTSDKAIFWISFVGAICFMLAFVLLVNLPGYIANPIKELTRSIREIASENYAQRVHFERHDEFGELASAFNTMAQKLDEYKTSNLERLMIEKKRVETLINNMNDPVFGLDEKNRVLFMNDVALKISGLKMEQVAGKPIQEIALQNDLVRSLAQDLLQKEKPATEIKPLPIKIYADNKESYFEKEIIPINIIPTGEKEERLIGNVMVLRNITPYKELDFAKTNFIATVSHELKTPISAIKMSTQLLENEQIGSLNPEQKGLLNGINDDANRLLKITGELLNLSQVDSGIMQLSIAQADPMEIVDYAMRANRTNAEQKNISLLLNVSEQLPKVLADSEKTAWVLTNLISNAIRYSYENSVVRINVSALNGEVIFDVTDTGQGIAPQYIDKIFDRYFRIPGNKKEGTGLGLAISKEFVAAQGGSITAKSEFGAGSTFSVHLPAVKLQVK
jgi:NtrC-family two-component system sensor histidine kinase KinB